MTITARGFERQRERDQETVLTGKSKGTRLVYVAPFYAPAAFTETDLLGNLVVLSAYRGPRSATQEDVSLIQSTTTVVPEPTTLTLFGVGSIGLLGYSLRRRNSTRRRWVLSLPIATGAITKPSLRERSRHSLVSRGSSSN